MFHNFWLVISTTPFSLPNLLKLVGHIDGIHFQKLVQNMGQDSWRWWLNKRWVIYVKYRRVAWLFAFMAFWKSILIWKVKPLCSLLIRVGNRVWSQHRLWILLNKSFAIVGILSIRDSDLLWLWCESPIALNWDHSWQDSRKTLLSCRFNWIHHDP